MNGEQKVAQLAQALAKKTVQLEQAVKLAGKAAEDLKKYRDLTGNLQGLRDILAHQRKHHHDHCKDEGCQWDLGTLAYLAHSMGMTSTSMDLNVLMAMVDQYEAQHAQQDKGGTVHDFKKGVADAGRSIPEAERPQKGLPVDDAANVSRPRPDGETTRRRPDVEGSAPKPE